MGSGDGMRRGRGGAVGFGPSFVRSEAFKALFQEGMGLVEAAALYLDGPGREDARALAPREALAYAEESLRLTTRLMQVAAWLLVQRALAEGQIDQAHARAERRRVRLTEEAARGPIDALPGRLGELVAETARLHARLLHLDRLTAEPAQAPEGQVGDGAADNQVERQRDLLRSAFGG